MACPWKTWLQGELSQPHRSVARQASLGDRQRDTHIWQGGTGGKERWAEAGAQRQAGREAAGCSELEGLQSRLARTRQWGGQLRTTKDAEVETQGGPRRQR